MPPVLRTWVARHPHIEIYIEPAPTTLLYSKVLSGELDGALLVHPLFAIPKTCAWRDLRQEPLVLATPADMKVRDPLAVLAREPYIRYDRSVVGGKMAEDYLRARNLRPHVRFELDGIESIARLVAEGLGVALLPDWATTGAPSSAVRRWPLPPPCPVRTVGAIWPRTGVRSALMQAFVELTETQLGLGWNRGRIRPAWRRPGRCGPTIAPPETTRRRGAPRHHGFATQLASTRTRSARARRQAVIGETTGARRGGGHAIEGPFDRRRGAGRCAGRSTWREPAYRGCRKASRYRGYRRCRRKW